MAIVARVRRKGAQVARDAGLLPAREHILRLAPKRAVCAELGVFRGAFSRRIVRAAQPAELHLIDCWWTVYGDRYPDWGAYTDYGQLSTRQAYDDARASAPEATVHVGDDLAVLAGFPDQYFDWIYLDTSHEYDQTVRELEILARKLKSDGLLLGDDWHDDPTHMHAGVTQAVEEACGRNEWHLIVPGDRFMQWAARRA